MTLRAFLITHGGALILPLAVVEGPVVAIVTGIVAAQGYFDWYWMLPLLVCADVIGDVLYYWIGRAGMTPLGRLLGIRGAPTAAFQRNIERNATKMLFIGKWTHTIGGLVLIGSGMLRLPLPRFILVNLIATIPKSAALFGVGYYAGDHIPAFERHTILATSVLGIAGVISILLILRRADGFRVSR